MWSLKYSPMGGYSDGERSWNHIAGFKSQSCGWLAVWFRALYLTTRLSLMSSSIKGGEYQSLRGRAVWGIKGTGCTRSAQQLLNIIITLGLIIIIIIFYHFLPAVYKLFQSKDVSYLFIYFYFCALPTHPRERQVGGTQ